MALIDAAQALGVTLAVTSAQGDWGRVAPYEQWPVHLGWGVSLRGAQVYFAPAAGEAFQIYAYPSEIGDAGVTLAASQSADFLAIGFDSSGLLSAQVGVRDGSADGGLGLPLTLGNVVLLGQQTSLAIGPGANVRLTAGGGVAFTPTPQSHGSWAVSPRASGGATAVQQIACAGSAAHPATLQDSAGMAFGQYDTASDALIDIGDFCSVTLQGATVGSCGPVGQPPPIEPIGIRVHGSGALTLNASVLKCLTAVGVELTAGDDAGVPAAALAGTIVDNCQCAGAVVAAGAFSAAGGAFTNSHVGVALTGPATVSVASTFRGDRSAGSVTDPQLDLSGAACSATPLPTAGGGAALMNLQPNATLVADNSRFDTSSLWTCADAQLTQCTCGNAPAGAGCPAGSAGSTNPTPFIDPATAVGMGSTAAFSLSGAQFQ